jgi:hypothetical protein
MNNGTRRFLATCLAVLLIPTLAVRADDRTIARAPLPPPLPTPPVEAQSGQQAGEPAAKTSIRFDDGSAVQPSQESPRPIAPARPGAGQAAAASDALPPNQPFKDRRGHGAAPRKNDVQTGRRELSPVPDSGEVASAERETTPPMTERLPAYQRQFVYPWPYGSPQAAGFPPYPPAPYRAEGYYPDPPPPPYFPNATPYRYP